MLNHLQRLLIPIELCKSFFQCNAVGFAGLHSHDALLGIEYALANQLIGLL
jgi:hypothetical protein